MYADICTAKDIDKMTEKKTNYKNNGALAGIVLLSLSIHKLLTCIYRSEIIGLGDYIFHLIPQKCSQYYIVQYMRMRMNMIEIERLHEK